jgi:hemolysin activation/secretion protein
MRPITRFSLFLLLLCAATMAMAQAPAAPAVPETKASFDILEFDVEGNSVLSDRDIERALNPFLGPARGFPDVEAARKALEDAYQKRGYQTVFAEIPEQRIVSGVVHLRVVEGTVGRSDVVGSRYFSLKDIATRAPELAAGKVPDLNAVQAELAQLNRLPDRQVSPILKPGRTPGTVDVDLSVKDDYPLHGELEADDRASAFTTPARLNASLRYDNLWQREHSIGVNFQISPQKTREVNVLYGTYLWKFRNRGDVLSAYVVRSNSNIAVVGSSTVLGKARIQGLRWIHPFETHEGYFHSVTTGFDRKDFGQTNINAQTGAPDILPPIHYVPFTVGYFGSLSRDIHQLQFSASFSTAPRNLFGNADAQFAGRRVVSSASYTVFKADLTYEARIGRFFGGYAKVEGQTTPDALIPNEQFTVGGAESVRGYRESEVLGDRGGRASLELRAGPPGWQTALDAPVFYGLVFADAGFVHTVDPQGPQLSNPTSVISSTGVGFHADHWHGVRLTLGYAHALRDGGQGASGTITPRGTNRIDASVAYGF